ncbi:MAG: YbaY family lipoprotein [Myxococcota bacterium]
MRSATRVREGAEGLSQRARAAILLVLAGAALASCRRPLVEPKAELAGGWLREPELALGFELRADGTLGLLGVPAQSGLAWNASHGELVLSTNSAQRVESGVARLRVAALEPDRLALSGDGEAFAGVYRRAQVLHVRGVLTYRERMELAPDARVEVELTQIGVGPIARQVFLARSQVPISFLLSLPASAAASGAALELAARIGDRERTLFATAEPLRVNAREDEVEVLLRRAR